MDEAAARLALVSKDIVSKGICVRQVRERGANFGAQSRPRLWNDIGDLPIWCRTLGVQSSDHDAFNLAAARNLSSQFQAFGLEPSPGLD